MMNWFKPKYTVCTACKVHFEPDSTDSLWAHLCHACRKPLKEVELRRQAVIHWANANWEKLEAQYLEEREKNEILQQQYLGVLGSQPAGETKFQTQAGNFGAARNFGLGL